MLHWLNRNKSKKKNRIHKKSCLASLWSPLLTRVSHQKSILLSQVIPIHEWLLFQYHQYACLAGFDSYQVTCPFQFSICHAKVSEMRHTITSCICVRAAFHFNSGSARPFKTVSTVWPASSPKFDCSLPNQVKLWTLQILCMMQYQSFGNNMLSASHSSISNHLPLKSTFISVTSFYTANSDMKQYICISFSNMLKVV